MFPKIADLYGRKKMYTVGIMTQVAVLGVLLVNTDYWLTLGLMFCMGILTTIRISIGYTYLMELIPADKKTLYSTIFWVCIAGVSSFLSTLYFAFISKNWVYLILGGTILNIIAGVCCLFLPESPLWLLKTGDSDGAEAALSVIADFNGAVLIFHRRSMVHYRRETRIGKGQL